MTIFFKLSPTLGVLSIKKKSKNTRKNWIGQTKHTNPPVNFFKTHTKNPSLGFTHQLPISPRIFGFFLIEKTRIATTISQL